jgi:Aspartyl protease
VLVTGLIVLAGCAGQKASSSTPSITVPLPVFPGDCASSPVPAGGHSTIPVKLVREPASRPSAVEIAAGVCVNGHGPFTFFVDTGAAVTVIDSGLAHRLGLGTVGDAVPNHTFGCDSSLGFLPALTLSVGGVALTPQPVATGRLASPEIPELGGLIGADILSRFGAVRIDYDHQAITVGPEGDEPAASVHGDGGSSAATSSLGAGTVSVIPADVHVATAPIPGAAHAGSTTFVSMQVSVVVGRHSGSFAVDTGAAQTAFSPPLARQAGRRVGPTQTFYGGLDCRIRVQPYAIFSWRIGEVELSPQVVAAAPVPKEWDGLLGSGTLQRYSPVVVDFKDGALLLGPGHGPQPVTS